MKRAIAVIGLSVVVGLCSVAVAWALQKADKNTQYFTVDVGHIPSNLPALVEKATIIVVADVEATYPSAVRVGVLETDSVMRVVQVLKDGKRSVEARFVISQVGGSGVDRRGSEVTRLPANGAELIGPGQRYIVFVTDKVAVGRVQALAKRGDLQRYEALPIGLFRLDGERPHWVSAVDIHGRGGEASFLEAYDGAHAEQMISEIISSVASSAR